ncbi:Chitinase 1 [Podochytrium sp. JEL0797]|nr:Chitinase 1 [Podochytrium sp. JEL0797]
MSNYQFALGDGKAIGTWLYGRFLGGSDPVRPFGNVVLDGIELDIEKGDPSWNQEMIDLITTVKTLSPHTTISIVPECYLYNQEAPGQNLGYYLYTGLVIAHFNATYSATASTNMLDYIIIQYYNNNICSYPYGFNYMDWKAMFKGPIVVGLAGDWTSAISGGFLELPDLQAVADEVLPDNQFGGFSVYDVSSSSAPYSTYSTSLSSVLNGTIVAKANAPQGPYKSETQYPWRCGATWHDADLSCSAKTCTSDNDCVSPEGCFKWLATC